MSDWHWDRNLSGGSAETRPTYTITPDWGPDMMLIAGWWNGRPAVAAHVGDELVVLNADQAAQVAELLRRLIDRSPVSPN